MGQIAGLAGSLCVILMVIGWFVWLCRRDRAPQAKASAYTQSTVITTAIIECVGGGGVGPYRPKASNPKGVG